MKSIYKIWPIVLFAIGLFFLFNKKDQEGSFDPEKVHLELFIPEKSQQSLNKQLESYPNVKKKYVDAEITYLDRKQSVKIKFHGTAYEHYFGKSHSYKIKIPKESDFDINGSKKLQLITYPEAQSSVLVANAFAKSRGLIAPTGEMIRATINGKEHVYYLVEHHDEAFFARNGYEKGVLLSQTTDWTRKEHTQRNVQHSSPFDWEIEHLEQKDSPYFGDAMITYQKLGDGVRTKNLDSIKQHIDLNYIAKFLTVAQLFNEIHFLTGDNLKWFYNAENQKLYPYYRQESEGKALPDNQLKNFADFDSHIFNHSLARYGVAENLDIFRLLLSDFEFRNLRNQWLYKWSTIDFNQFSDSMSQVQSENIHLSGQSKRLLDLQKEIFSSTTKLAQSYLNYGHIYGTYSKSSKQLSLIFDAMTPVEIVLEKRLILQNKGLDLSENLTFSYTKQVIRLEENEIESLKFKNTVTQQLISKEQIHWNVID